MPPDVDKAGLMVLSEIAGSKEIRDTCGQHITRAKSESHGATAVRPISIALTGTASYSGVFQPEELEILQRVFDRVCRERKCRPESGEAEAIAATIIVFFQTGGLTEQSS